jgi:hypothetical protein
MRTYKVTYLQEDYSTRVKFIAAETTDEARSLVYNDTLNCIQTLKAELVFSGPMRMGDHHYYDLNGDMANEFNESFHSDML